MFYTPMNANVIGWPDLLLVCLALTAGIAVLVIVMYLPPPTKRK